jgi:hypothetical protein
MRVDDSATIPSIKALQDLNSICHKLLVTCAKALSLTADNE